MLGSGKVVAIKERQILKQLQKNKEKYLFVSCWLVFIHVTALASCLIPRLWTLPWFLHLPIKVTAVTALWINFPNINHDFLHHYKFPLLRSQKIL
jgi:hypothetical protein